MSERAHGYSRYRLNKCRCAVCRAARYAYDRKVAIATTRGEWRPYVDAQPVREHIEMLTKVGLGHRRIADLAGVGSGRIQAIIYGQAGREPSRRVRPAIAEAILAVRPVADNLADHQLIDSTGTIRRARALAAIGWSFAEQARRCGQPKQSFYRFLNSRKVMVTTARRVAALYDQLSMTPAPNTESARRGRARAMAAGWPPPLAWDDDTIDSPYARPAGWLGAPDRETLREFAERYQPLAAQGLPWSEIADRLTLTVNAAKARARRARNAGFLDQEAIAA